MEAPALGSLDGACQNSSKLRIELRKLIKAYGADVVKRVFATLRPQTQSRTVALAGDR